PADQLGLAFFAQQVVQGCSRYRSGRHTSVLSKRSGNQTKGWLPRNPSSPVIGFLASELVLQCWVSFVMHASRVHYRNRQIHPYRDFMPPARSTALQPASLRT